MIDDRKPRIGLLGIMQELYDDDIPNITEHQEKYAREVCDQLSDVADWEFPRAARNRDDIEEILGDFNHHGLDGVMIVMLTYGPAMRTVRALQNNNLPLLLANIQPVPEVTTDWDMDDLTYNQGIHGAQDMANAILRTSGDNFEVISADWKSDEFEAYVGDWASAAQTAATLKEMKIASIGKMHGMGDTLSDEAAFTRIVGPEVNREYIGQIYRNMEAVSDEEIETQVATEKERFEVDEDMPAQNLNYAARMYLGFKQFLEEGNYSGFSAHFDTFKGDGRFDQINMLAASNLMAEGYGYAAEGDTNTASMVAAAHVLDENAHFTEMYAMDFKRGSMLMSHMGEGNWKVARSDEPVRLANRELGIGDLDNPPTTVFRTEPGPATIASIVHLVGDEFRLVVAQGEVLDSQKYPTIEMPYFHFKPDSGLRDCNDNWLRAGGTHHQTLLMGDQRRKWQMLCRILDIEYVEV
ncbi:L-fucose/L-arabinose isomerase family protein [Fodinibius salsisoli]|uniref:L-fucose/L-arabinose isomerase family protein n=1 Tax=Fodinibius salsisoli TaxID=2820877 RepID=A0ABT3PJI9_9BACT|nr:L-fucose/L-arabinose isomerase family protein [Fodinibius salsisoli]MCW9706082.1 L-fucose/L-arabinose isomerase family protein [Fodinibius salsisoli]